MDETMRVMWCERPNQVEVRRQAVYDLGDDDVLIRVAYTGVCPWDVRAYSGLKSSVAFPRILGHETAGTVAAVGNHVTRFKAGQRVVPDLIVKCGVCKACRTGRSNVCQNPTFMQFGGGYADYVRVPQQNVHLVSQPETPLQAAAFTEPLSCVLRGQDGLHLYPGEIELVVGVGPIGLMHLQVARAFGARVIASDTNPQRLEKAREMGAEWVINPSQENLAGFVRKVTEGWGADAAVITAASARAVEEVIPLLARGGRLNIFAGIYPKDEIHVDPNLVHYGELVITGSSDSTSLNYHRALALIESGQVNTETLISHILPLEELAQAFTLVKNQTGLKIMMQANGEG